jgi:hypothetical protein
MTRKKRASLKKQGSSINQQDGETPAAGPPIMNNLSQNQICLSAENTQRTGITLAM